LSANLFEYGIGLEFIHMLLPFLGSAEVTQIGEEEINFEVEVRMQVVRLYIQLRPEQNYIVHFDFFLAVSNQESL